MNEAVLVNLVEGQECLPQDFARLVGVQLFFSIDVLVEVGAIDEFEGDVVNPVRLAGIVDGDDVFVP